MTGRNLHSHAGYKSPLTNRQEVTGYGDDGFGDGGDDWKIICDNKPQLGKIKKQEGDEIDGKTLFYLQHVATGKFLITDYTDFNNKNCPRCPINGQFEISSVRA